MAAHKTLSFAFIILLFGACSAPKAAPDTRPVATPSKSMDLARSDLDASDAPARSINPSDARNYIGMRQTVCGVVVGASYDARSSGRETTLYLDEPYPRHIFTAVIWGNNREKFGAPEITLLKKRVCVSGVIEESRGFPQIVLRDADQLVEEVD